MVKRLLIVVALAVGIGVEKSAVASPYYYVHTSYGPTKEDDVPVSTAGNQNLPPNSFDPYDPGAYIIAEGSATAKAGSLGVRSVADLYFPGSNPYTGSTHIIDSYARFIIDDFVLSGPGSAVSGSLRLRLSGGVSGNAVLFGQTLSYGSARGTVYISGNGFGTGFSGSREVKGDTTNGLQPAVESGVLVGGVGLISMPFVNAPVGTPLTLQLSLQANVSAHVTGNGSGGFGKVAALGSSAFYETLSFDTSGPAFVLPEGYRADSPTARVVDSIFIPEPRPGDYNDDREVNAADYVVWRKYTGTTTSLPNDLHGGTIGGAPVQHLAR